MYCSEVLALISTSKTPERILQSPQYRKEETCLLRQRHRLYEYCTTYLKFHMKYIDHTNKLWLVYSDLVLDLRIFREVAISAHPKHKLLRSPHLSYAETPLGHVLRFGALDLVRRFVSRGYPVDEHTDETDEWVLYSPRTTSTELHKYIALKQSKTASLLELGTDPNKINRSGRSALHLAILCKVSDIERQLLAHPDVEVNAEDYCGITPLHCQVSSRSFPTLLYDTRVDVSKVNRYVITAMALSAFWADQTAFRGFLERP